MKPAMCRLTLLSLLLLTLSGGCAAISLPGMAKRSGKTPNSVGNNAILTAGFPRLGQIRIPKPGAKAAQARSATRCGAGIKQRAEETRQANARKLNSREPNTDESAPKHPKTRDPIDSLAQEPLSREALSRRDVKAPEIPRGDAEDPEFGEDLAGFDQTTQALIRSELRDANSLERQQLLHDLRNVSADMVPKILSIRRAALNYKSGPGSDSVSPASGVSSASKAEEDLPGPSAGLGAGNPWKANYAPPPVGSPASGQQLAANSSGNIPQPDSQSINQQPNSNSRVGPEFPANSNQLANPYAPSPEQLAAQLQASTSSVGLPNAGQNPMLSGLMPPQAMGMLANPAQPGVNFGNQGMIPLTAQPTPNPYLGGLTPNPQTAISGSGYQLSPPLTSTPQNNSPPQNQMTPGAMNAQNFGSHSAPATPPAMPQQQVPAVPASAVAFNNSSLTNNPPTPPLNGNGWANENLPNYNALPTANHSPEWQQHLQALIASAEAEAAQLTPGTTEQEKQRYIEAHVQLRMMYLMAGRQQRALAHIPGIDPADQEFWQQVMWGTTNYFDIRQIPSAGDRATQTVAQFQAASSRLREKAQLELRGLNFCNQIYGFGDIEKFPGGNEFTPGTQVLVYAEVSNFKSDLAPDGRYHSKLKPSYEILRPGGQGQLVEQKNVAPIEDACNNHRQDFYFFIKLSLPEQIAQGPYVLRLTLEDELSRKIAVQTLNFTVK